MKRIAVLGASGFVGSRFVELAALTGAAEVVPVVRSHKGGARLSRFGPVWKLADANSAAALAPVIARCDAVVNLTLGELSGMSSGSVAMWDACAAAQVPAFVHLSSAEVFGRVEKDGLHDDSPPPPGHWMSYARAKADAETALRPRFADTRVRCHVLRPGLIWGPRSPWVEGPAKEISEGGAFLIGGGAGICNLIYVDNLIHSILGIVNNTTAPSGFYNVSDDETVTWRQYYEGLARQLGVPFSTIHQLPEAPYKKTVSDRLDKVKQGPVGKWLKRKLDKPAKQKLKRMLASMQTPPPDSGPAPAPAPVVTRGMWHLQNTRNKLPTTKFTKTFGALNEFSFNEAMERTGAWLRFAGFVRERGAS